MVNNCKAILAERHCSFRASDCSFSDSSFYDSSSSETGDSECLFGYMKDSMGCVIDSCTCNTDPEGEMHYGDIIVTKKMMSMMAAPDAPDGVQRAADISVARWTQYRQGKPPKVNHYHPNRTPRKRCLHPLPNLISWSSRANSSARRNALTRSWNLPQIQTTKQ